MMRSLKVSFKSGLENYGLEGFFTWCDKKSDEIIKSSNWAKTFEEKLLENVSKKFNRNLFQKMMKTPFEIFEILL